MDGALGLGDSGWAKNQKDDQKQKPNRRDRRESAAENAKKRGGGKQVPQLRIAIDKANRNAPVDCITTLARRE
jgi:hypothetical protein